MPPTYPLQHKKKAAIHLTDTRQYPQLFLFVDYECIFLLSGKAPTDFALLKSVVRENWTFPLTLALGAAPMACQSDFALLKSVVRALRKDRLTTAHFVARVRFVKTERFHSHWHWGLRPRRARQISLLRLVPQSISDEFALLRFRTQGNIAGSENKYTVADFLLIAVQCVSSTAKKINNSQSLLFVEQMQIQNNCFSVFQLFYDRNRFFVRTWFWNNNLITFKTRMAYNIRWRFIFRRSSW